MQRRYPGNNGRKLVLQRWVHVQNNITKKLYEVKIQERSDWKKLWKLLKKVCIAEQVPFPEYIGGDDR